MPARVRSVGTAQSGTGGVTPGLPSGHVANDILLLFVRTANEPISAPTGYTQKGSTQGTGTAAGSAATSLQLFWKRDSGSESAPSVADSGNSTTAQIIAIAGCPTSGDPFDAIDGDVLASASTSVTIPGVTTTEDNALVLVAVANEADSATAQTSGWSNGTLKALIERADANTTSNNGGGFGVASARMPTAGATGTTSATLATSSVQARIVCAMKSADGGDLYAGIQAVAAAVAGGAHKIAVTAGNSLMAGDSSTGDNMGSNAKNSAIAARVPLYLTGYAASNASFFGDGAANIAAGRTPHEYNSLVTLASGWSADDSQVSAGGAPYTSSGSGTSLSFAPGVTFDRIVPINARYAGGANYTVDIGGSTLATLDMNGSPNAVIKHTPISCTSGVNTLYFDSTGAGGFIFGAYVYENASPKLHIINLGWAGSTTADWNNSADFKALQVLAALAPDILIFENGNDLLNGVSETTFKANVRAIVTPQLDRGAAVLLMPPHYIDPGIISTPTQDAYSGWWYDLGYELGVPVYDPKTRPDRTSFAAADAAGFMAGDGIHGTGLGYDDQAQGLAEVIDYSASLPEIDATLAVTLGAVTAAASASTSIAATLAKTLDAATASAAGAGAINAQLTASLAATTLSASSLQERTATLAVELDPATASASGAASIGAAGAIGLDAIDVASQAASSVAATLAANLQSAALSSEASSGVSATLAVTLSSASLAGAGGGEIDAQAAIALGSVSAAALAVSAISAQASIMLGGVTVAAVSAAAIGATFGNSLAPVSVAAAASSGIDATVAVQLDDASMAAEATHEALNEATLAVTLDPVAITAGGQAAGDGQAAITLQAATLSASATAGLVAYLGVTLSSVAASSAASTSVAATFSASLDAAALEASGSTAGAANLSATLDDVGVQAVGVGEIVATLSATLGAITLSAAAQGVVITITPASRTLAILGERRTLAVPGENRSLAVQGEDRTLRAS